MKKFFVALSLSLLLAGPAIAGDQDFTLVNQTGVEIAELYVSPASVDDWQEDVLSQDTLPDGESLDINFARDEDADFWDLKVVDGEGNSIEWPHLKLTDISQVTLTIDNNKPVATIE